LDDTNGGNGKKVLRGLRKEVKFRSGPELVRYEYGTVGLAKKKGIENGGMRTSKCPRGDRGVNWFKKGQE